MKHFFFSLFLVFSILSCDKKEISDEDEFSEDNPTEQEMDPTLVLSYQTSVVLKHTLNWHYGAPQGEVTIDWGDGEKDFYPSGIPETVSHFYTATVEKNYTVNIYADWSGASEIFGISSESIKELYKINGEHIRKIKSRSIKDVNFPKLDKIASDAFHGIPNVESFDYAFNGSPLTSLPKGLFDNCKKVSSFEGTFNNCTLLTTIPKGLFKNCSNVLSFSRVFSSCSSLTSIPEGLFDNCTVVEDFTLAFFGCSSIISIPEGLFDYCPEVTSFVRVFEGCRSLTSIPKGLFDNCLNVTSFSSTFSSCNSLTSIPKGLFDKNINVINFNHTFFYCSSLISIPLELFDNNIKARYFSSTLRNCSSLISAPKLWEKFPLLSGNLCYEGSVNLPFYESIPKDWLE